MADILFLAADDHANLGYHFNESLKAVGLNSLFLKANVNKTYAKQGQRANLGRMAAEAKKAKVIVFLHSTFFRVPIKGKRVFVVHGGSKYRNAPQNKNKFFNPMVEKTVVQTADLLGLGAKNEVWVLPPIDVSDIKPIYKQFDQDRLIISHFPSSVYGKSTDIIEQVVNRVGNFSKFKNRFIFNSPRNRVDNTAQSKRMARCDVYVEACTPHIYHRHINKWLVYGEWGLTCLEAAALGKVVITHFLNTNRYLKEYGPHPLCVANNAVELEDHIINLLRMFGAGHDNIMDLKKRTRSWVEDNHSYKAVGKRFLDKVLGGKV